VSAEWFEAWQKYVGIEQKKEEEPEENEVVKTEEEP
jgi:hypothetical protein